MLRTPDEIMRRCRNVNGADLFGTQVSDLLVYLDFEHAKEFLIDAATREEFDREAKQLTAENVIKEMHEYMPFAIGKCVGHRGLSANRSMDHYISWLWLLGDEEKVKAFDAAPYENYGAPRLKLICDWHMIPILPGDDNYDIYQRDKFLRMAEGKKCSDDCREGCGKTW